MATAEAMPVSALKTRYEQEIVAGLKEQFGITNEFVVGMALLQQFGNPAQGMLGLGEALFGRIVIGQLSKLIDEGLHRVWTMGSGHG